MRTHRRSIPKSAFDALPERLLASARRSAALLRLAVLLQRSHETDALPDLGLVADGDSLTLTLPRRWLDARPLLRADLSGEIGDFAALGITLELDTT